MNFRKITVINNREIGGTNTALQKVAFMSCKETDGDCVEINTMILKNKTKDIYVPYPKMSSLTSNPFSQWIIMRTHSNSAEPVVDSNYCDVVGNAISGTVRFTVIHILESAPNEFTLTVS